MIGEISLYGLYVPPLLLLALAAMGVVWGINRVLARLGVHRLVWHPALLDVALFVIVLATLSYLTSDWH